jgi:hypothetical protein
VFAGAYPYDCPADALLDVSWHRTPNDTRSDVTQWLIRPDLAGVVSVSALYCVLLIVIMITSAYECSA